MGVLTTESIHNEPKYHKQIKISSAINKPVILFTLVSDNLTAIGKIILNSDDVNM